jgi:hypothetical protein
MEQHGEAKGADYPRGRGYGHDYMRGGEVFGGYGYSQRDEYGRPRGELGHTHDGSSEQHGEAADAGGTASGGGEETDEEPFPQDERAGGWGVPHDLDAEHGPADPLAPEPTGASRAERTPSDSTESSPPVPQLEHTFGDTGGNRLHSRSYYVTQAQLQQRLYARPDHQSSRDGLTTP